VAECYASWTGVFSSLMLFFFCLAYLDYILSLIIPFELSTMWRINVSCGITQEPYSTGGA